MGRLKMFCALPRKKEVSSQWFHDHWRHPHGTLGMKISTVRNYVQSHQIDSALLGSDQRRYEGVVEVWFDSETDAAALPDHPTYRRYLVPDEPTFIDMDEIRFLFTHEEILVSGPDPGDAKGEGDLAWQEADRATSIKLIQFVETGGMSAWADDLDIELGRRIGALRHALCRPSNILHPDGGAFIGVRELWWPTLTAFETGVEADPDAFRKLTARPASAVSLLVHAERFI